MNITARTFFSLCLFVFSPICGIADDNTLRKQFIEGVGNIPKLLLGVSVRAKVTQTQRYVLHDERAARAYFSSHAKKENPDKNEVDVRYVSMHGGSVLDIGTDRRKVEFVKSENGKYAFMLTKPPGGDKYNISALMSQSEIRHNDRMQKGLEKIKDTAISSVFTYLGCGTQLIYDLVKSPDFKIENVSEAIVDGTSYVRVDCTFPLSPGSNHSYRNAYLLCDPKNNWAVKEFYADGPTETGSIKVVTTFGESLNGFPITKKSVTTLANSAIPSITSSIILEVDELSKDVGPEEFALTHYGIPEPDFSTPWISTWMKYLLAGLSCTAIAYWIKRRRAAATG